MMPVIFDRTIDSSDVRRGLEENLWSLWSRFGRGKDCRLHDENGAVWFDTPIPTLPYNAVIRFTAENDVDGRIDALFNHYSKRGVPFLWIVHPSAKPLDLSARLRARGMEEAETCPGMAINLDDLPPQQALPDGVEISEVSDETDAARLLELVGWRWAVPRQALPALAGVTQAFEVGMPGSKVRCWLAWQDGVPVAKALLHLAAGVAGLYGVVTRPEARGLGLARSLTIHAFSVARRQGYATGVLHSTPTARGLYEKIGCRAYADFKVFAPPRTLHL
jgi:ribosomal protein S18 acetylase RimI-like enzyme